MLTPKRRHKLLVADRTHDAGWVCAVIEHMLAADPTMTLAEVEAALRDAAAHSFLSRPISVKGVGDKDADAKNYKKCCNNFKHRQPSQNNYWALTQCLVRSRPLLHSQNDSTATQCFCCY